MIQRVVFQLGCRNTTITLELNWCNKHDSPNEFVKDVDKLAEHLGANGWYIDGESQERTES
jgi:hypothetical protein